MKLGTDRHPKFLQLMAILKIPRREAGGLLEFLWHGTATLAPAGNIGKFPNYAIAALAGWDGDPDVFVDALVKCQWLDESADHRLIVHDWQDHAPLFIQRRGFRAARTGKAFFAGAKAPPPSEPKQAPPAEEQPDMTPPSDSQIAGPPKTFATR